MIENNTVDVYIVNLEEHYNSCDSFHTFLSPDEKERANKFVSEDRKINFITTRGILRSILSYYINIAASDIRFCYGENGRPDIEDIQNSKNISFNMSHSKNIAVYVVARSFPVGIDIEYQDKNIKFEQLAKRFFFDKEYENLISIPEQERKNAFFRCWTRKEAYIKSRGEAMWNLMKKVEISILPSETAQIINDPEYPDFKDWLILDIEIPFPYLGSVAAKNKKAEIRYKSYSALC